MTTIIFLALAVFVIWRLRSVLGQKTGQERPPLTPSFGRDKPVKPNEGDNVIRLGQQAPKTPPTERWKDIAEAGTPLAKNLDEIAAIEPEFDAKGFLEGAKSAYEMIVIAFAKGERQTLKDLLSREVFEGFERAVIEREKRGEKVETTFVSIDKTTIEAVEVKNRVAQVTLRFVSKLITATRDGEGKVIDGDPEAVVGVTDVWTFARPLGSRDPNWHLVATEAGH